MPVKESRNLFRLLRKKASWVRKKTLDIHGIAPETRLASSLSSVEIFVTLYYGGLLKFDAKNPLWEERDRFIVSKGHGAVSLYPVLADLGFLDPRELKRVCRQGSRLGAVPDSTVPGIETMNGSLGHGLGVACGMALALKRKRSDARVFVLLGDGELFEGAVWEAIMFAGQHRLDNLISVVDNNGICMLDYCRDVIDLSPLEKKFESFKWRVATADGHDVEEIYHRLAGLKESADDRPGVLIADTVKGKGVALLERDVLCHIRSLKEKEIITARRKLQ